MEIDTKLNLNDLLEIITKINSERKITELLLLIADETTKIMGCEKASVFLLDQNNNELWSVTTVDGTVIKFDSRLGIAGEAVTTRKTIRVNNVKAYRNFYKGIDAQTGYDTKKIIVGPLFNKSGDIIGTFQALNKKKGDFTKSDQQLVETIAKHIAVSIENARLFESHHAKEGELRNENARLKHELKSKYSTKNIIGNSPPIQDIIRLIEHISDVFVDVLITGESGTGKELIARAIHFSGVLGDKPFVSINCAAIPENLFESELFGIEKGIATGVEKRIGKFEKANKGTLFLDEIGDLSLSSQAKILRALQERVVERVGGSENIPVDVRIIAATNKELDKEIQSGNFREDLLYRLKVINIKTPPLRTIYEDIPQLSQSFMSKFCSELKIKNKKFSKSAMDILKNYHWPGNIRELENEMKRLSVICHNNTVHKEDLSSNIKSDTKRRKRKAGTTLKEAVEQLEVNMIKEALELNNNNKHRASSYLGLSRWGLTKKMKRYGLAN